MSTNPLVSVIVTTRNNHDTLDACLASIKAQSYAEIELLVVDNNSTDDTLAIAQRYTSTVYTKGPERSTQRNFGVQHASGQWLLIIDSDMELAADVVGACVKVTQQDKAVEAVIIPEESFGVGFWAQCKRLERSYYVGQDMIEAPRFFSKQLFETVGGYSEEMIGGEDWDLSRRMAKLTQIRRVDVFIRHNEGRLYFGKTARKMYYYAQHAVEYFAKNPSSSALTDSSGPLARYKLFFSKPGKLFAHPLIGIGMLILKTTEYASGSLGYMKAKLTYKPKVGRE